MGFDCSWTGLEWKFDESFRELGFFSVGGLNSLGQPNSARRANFQKLENETCPGKLFAGFSKVAGILGAFARAL